jgi:hypothetical protein
MLRLDLVKVLLKPSIIDRKDWVRYLVLVNWHAKQLENVLTSAADATFLKFVDKHVQAYLDGTAPPESIQTAVMNIADDLSAGREMTLRSGDYVALQTEFQKQSGANKRSRR